MATVAIVTCDMCKAPVKGDNSDSWAGKLPVPSIPPTEEELKENPKLTRSKYSISHVDICFPCVGKIGDWFQSQKKS